MNALADARRHRIRVGIQSNAVTAAAAVALLVIGAVLGGPLRSCYNGDPLPAGGYTRVAVDSASAVEGEPDAELGVIESVVRPQEAPTVVATAAGAARGDVAGFCSAAGYVLPGLGDTAASAPNPPLAPAGVVSRAAGALGIRMPEPRRIEALAPTGSVLLARSGVETRTSLNLRLVSSSGALVHAMYDDCRLPRTWRAAGNDVVVQCNSWWWIPPALGTALGAGLVYLGATSEDELVRSAGMTGGAFVLGWSIPKWW